MRTTSTSAQSPVCSMIASKLRERIYAPHGPQYRSAHFAGSLAWLGISDDPAFLGEPETNGCAERWIRTLKDQCLWAELHDTVDELRRAVTTFVTTYNAQWLIQRHGHRTSKEAYQEAAQSTPAP